MSAVVVDADVCGSSAWVSRCGRDWKYLGAGIKMEGGVRKGRTHSSSKEKKAVFSWLSSWVKTMVG